MATVMVEIPVDEETAAALTDPHQSQAVGELVKLIIRPAPGHDPLAARWKPPAARPLLPA